MTEPRTFLVAAAILTLPGIAPAQEEAAPLSAIDWLSRSVEVAQPAPGAEPPVADDATTPAITVTPLDGAPGNALGLLPPELSGLPRSLWSASQVETLVELIAAERPDGNPAIQALLTRMMLAEADPPLGGAPGETVLLARVDKLLDLGALEPAQALLEAAGPVATAERFRRSFDIALLLGTEDEACATMRSRPALAPTLPARVFCLAREGDWPAAALTLNTAIALGDVTEAEQKVLTRFLDDSLDDVAEPLPVPERISPLVFRLYEAIGEALPTADLPRAFAHADLRPMVAWRLRLEAAERLARVGAIDAPILFDLYNEARPAASGGIWDRAAAVQALDAALVADDAGAVAAAIGPAWAAMEAARTEVAFAEHYGPALAKVPLSGEALRVAQTAALLSPDVTLPSRPEDGRMRLLAAVARGTVAGLAPDDPVARAVVAAFAGATLPEPLARALDEGRTGEALLRAVADFNAGVAGDTGALTDALATLRAAGLEDVARQAALQALILDRGAG